MLAAYVWHWWIGVILFLVAVLMVVALLIGYVVKVKAPQYPKPGTRIQQ